MEIKAAEPSSSRSALSWQIWRLDWSAQLPRELGGVLIELTDFPTVARFLTQRKKELLTPRDESNPFQSGDFDSGVKLDFYTRLADCMAFRDPRTGETVGIFMGNPLDWSSYYLRYVILLPEYRSRGIFGGFLAAVLAALEATGVERAECEICPVNHPEIHLLNRLGFQITGTVLSERWGALARFTRFLSPKHQAIFANQFCSGEFVPPHGSRPSRAAIPTKGGN